MAWAIVAVAIGSNIPQRIIRSQADLTGLRPYIPGLIDGLRHTNPSYVLGTDYIIDYRERTKDQLVTNPAEAFRNPAEADHVIFGMSTTVVKAAQAVTESIKIIGIVSDPAQEQIINARNICSLSARRTQTADDCFDRFFDAIPTLTEVRPLHFPNYTPSVRALANVRGAAGPKHVAVNPVEFGSFAELEYQLRNLPPRNPANPATSGIQVLPVDLCLGAAPTIIDIVQTQKNLPAFFPITDWVKPALPSAFGGYGIPQDACGQLLAERVDYARKNAVPFPNPPSSRHTVAPNSAFRWVVSRAAAQALNIEVPNGVPTI
jgi:hypothetical protein